MRNACALVGIEAIAVADAKRNHAWCKAKINGTWYNFDSTIPFFVGSFLRDKDIFKDDPEGPEAVLAHTKNLRTRWVLKLQEIARRYGFLGRNGRKLLNAKNERIINEKEEKKDDNNRFESSEYNKDVELNQQEEKNETIRNDEMPTACNSWDLASFGTTKEEVNEKIKNKVEANILNKKTIGDEKELQNEQKDRA